MRLTPCVDWAATLQPAEVRDFAEFFKESGAGVEALWLYNREPDLPRIAALTRDPRRLASALRRVGVRPRPSRCWALPYKGAALARALRLLSKAGVPVRRASAVSPAGSRGPTVWVDADDLPAARGALSGAFAGRRTSRQPA